MTPSEVLKGTQLALKTIRISHWIKNLLIFVPLIFAGGVFDLHLFLTTTKGFLGFCAASSIGYIYNDWRDRKFDAKHPKKKERALASGDVKEHVVVFVSVTLFVFMILVSRNLNLNFQKYLYLYLLGTLLYSFFLKNLPYLEILTIGLLFLCRVFAGASLTSVQLTNNFIVIVGASSMYFLTSKRLSEKSRSGSSDTRQVLNHYSILILRRICTALLMVTIISYLYWIYQPRNSSIISWLTIAPVFVAMVRFVGFQKMSKTENPIELFTNDLVLMICSGVFLSLTILKVYLV